MTIEKLIEKGIEGGWRWSNMTKDLYTDEQVLKFLMEDYEQPALEEILLDPKFWEAVGKVEGWFVGEICDKNNNCVRDDEYRHKMHQMIDHLCNGGSIEEFISKL